ncbi:MAG: NAD(P)-dependent oxidoreductase [Enterobacteriaceae bacterium]
MKILVFSSSFYDEKYFSIANKNYNFEISYFRFQLNESTVKHIKGYNVVCVFTNDICNSNVLNYLFKFNIKILALRCAGFNNVDLKEANKLGIKVVRVPCYSPQSIAEYTLGLILCLTRNILSTYNYTSSGNFNFKKIIGKDLSKSTIGIIGFGNIGKCLADILLSFKSKILVYDPVLTKNIKSNDLEYVDLFTIYNKCDVITLHCPLKEDTYHMINSHAFDKMKKNVIIINTSRGGLINIKDAVRALENGKIGGLGIDVCEEEKFLHRKKIDLRKIFYLKKICNYKNVIYTNHQSFLTYDSFINISNITLKNIYLLSKNKYCKNIVLI